MVAGLVRKAKDQRPALTGPGGLLKSLTKTVLKTALEEELSEHLGYDKPDPVGRNLDNSRNGYRSKTVVTDAGSEVEIAVPRDREGSFEPQIVGKRKRRLTDLDQLVISLSGPRRPGGGPSSGRFGRRRGQPGSRRQITDGSQRLDPAKRAVAAQAGHRQATLVRARPGRRALALTDQFREQPCSIRRLGG